MARGAKPELKLIGAAVRPTSAKQVVALVKSGADPARLEVDAIALEEDTSLVLSASPELRDPGEHPIRLMTALYDSSGHEVGTVLVQGRRPYRLLAIVHDLDEEPTWREEWIAAALAGVLSRCAALGVRSLALEPLGAKHGRLPAARFDELLDEALAGAPPSELRRVWVLEA